MSDQKRAGFIAILGAPNVGKSTLLNRLVGQKISIVSPRVQTTRFRIRGVCMEGEAQLVFVDTPGIFAGRKGLEQAMVDEAWAGAGDADVIALMVDATHGVDEGVEAIIGRLKQSKTPPPLEGRGHPVCVIINKIDLVDKRSLLALAQVLSGYELFDEIFMVSAAKGDGLEACKGWFAGQVPEGEWFYPPDQLTDLPMRLLAAEITREKLFYALRQELPYSVTVETENWEERDNGTVAIAQAIIVEREGQKKIVIGKGGVMLKEIGSRARRELEAELGCKVFLQLFVKVEPNWKAQWVKNLGIGG